MLLGLLIGLGAAAAALVLYLVVEQAGPSGVPLAFLRALVWGALAALLVNPSCRRSGGAPTTVLLDGSRSMTDPDGEARWRAAVDSARAAAGTRGRVLVFGDMPQLLAEAQRPVAGVSRLLPALREAAAGGGPIVIVTDGEVDDAWQLPADQLRRARVVTLSRPERRDAGVAALDLPTVLRAGDTAVAVIEVGARGVERADSVTVELFEGARRVAHVRASVGTGGARTDLKFVPAVASGEREVRRYEARLAGFARDGEPRDDVRATLAVVTRASTIAALSDSPDWDFRSLVRSLEVTAGVPILAYVRLSPDASWREARGLRVVPERTISDELSRALLVVAHGSAAGVAALTRRATRNVWVWPTVGVPSVAGDWYVERPALTSPVGGALGGVPVESLPPLETVIESVPNSVEWTGLTAQLDRRGRARSVMVGEIAGGRRRIAMTATGLWRWASRGGVSAEAHRAIVAAATDWLLEAPGPAQGDLSAARDSLARETREFLPRASTLAAQSGTAAAGEGELAPLRHRSWLYFLALAALIAEWIARRRRGLR